MLSVLQAIAAWFKSHSPAGTLNVADFIKAAISYLISSGGIYVLLAYVATNAVDVGNPAAAALIAGMANLVADLLHRFANGPVVPPAPTPPKPSSFTTRPSYG